MKFGNSIFCFGIFEWKLQKYDQIPSDGNLGKYDIHSIMHYDGTLRGYFRNPIMVDKLTGNSIGVNRKMSPLDIQKLNEMYPCKQTSLGKLWFTEQWRSWDGLIQLESRVSTFGRLFDF